MNQFCAQQRLSLNKIIRLSEHFLSQQAALIFLTVAQEDVFKLTAFKRLEKSSTCSPVTSSQIKVIKLCSQVTKTDLQALK